MPFAAAFLCALAWSVLTALLVVPVSLVLKADIRPGFEGQLTAKVERVEQHLGG